MLKAVTSLAIILLCLSAFAAGSVIHVPSEQPTIQAGIDAAVNGDIVLVADGTYTGDGNRNLDFNGKSITVSSESVPENCIIDCLGNGRGFRFHSGEDENAVVHGFTIRNGYVQADGAGILVEAGSSPVISNCILTDNSTPGWPWSGGGAFLSGGLIRDCIIHDNRADEGGGLFLTEGAMAYNCLIVNNIAYELGGGICTGWASSAGVSHCTIADNEAGEFGGGIYTRGMVLTNSITWGNWAVIEGDDGYINGYYSTIPFNCSYTNLGGEWVLADYSILDPGDGIIAANPLFVTGLMGSWYLSQTVAGQPEDSPCVDTGDPDGPTFGTSRTDHQPDSGVPDMGYHYALLDTVAADLSCVPDSGVLPFAPQFSVTLGNAVAYYRTVAGRINLTLAGGATYQSWRAGYTNLGPNETFVNAWMQTLPALGSLVGANVFELHAEDVTPAPYNQPPYPPAGATDTAACTVTGIAP